MARIKFYNPDTGKWEYADKAYGATVTDEQIAQAVEEYMAENPVDVKTPIKGTDYWTDADKAEIKGYVDEAILGGAW